ncbi:DUF4296 domain-containing protein [Mucilaginibacter limnophilus]|nr:DUF4296 domain-containing protein [Mucilaginibacter limnophilus]
MSKYIGLFFSALLILCSCNDDRPKGILDEKQMANVLADVHITNGTMLAVSGAPDTLYKYGTGRYQNVFKNHHTDSAQFTKSLKYYASKPEELLAVYDEVLKKLQTKSDSLNKVFQKETAANAKKQLTKPTVVRYRQADTIKNRLRGKLKRPFPRSKNLKE